MKSTEKNNSIKGVIAKHRNRESKENYVEE